MNQKESLSMVLKLVTAVSTASVPKYTVVIGFIWSLVIMECVDVLIDPRFLWMWL